MEGHVIGELIKKRGLGKNSREGWRNSREEGEGSLIGLLCSRNARSRTPLVGRAQWETDSGHPPSEKPGVSP